jgi:hypothetical protein
MKHNNEYNVRMVKPLYWDDNFNLKILIFYRTFENLVKIIAIWRNCRKRTTPITITCNWVSIHYHPNMYHSEYQLIYLFGCSSTYNSRCLPNKGTSETTYWMGMCIWWYFLYFSGHYSGIVAFATSTMAYISSQLSLMYIYCIILTLKMRKSLFFLNFQ